MKSPYSTRFDTQIPTGCTSRTSGLLGMSLRAGIQNDLLCTHKMTFSFAKKLVFCSCIFPPQKKNVSRSNCNFLRIPDSRRFLRPGVRRKKVLFWLEAESPRKWVDIQFIQQYTLLVGGFNPSKRYSRQIGSFPQGSE